MGPDSTPNPNTLSVFLNVFPSSHIPDALSSPWMLELEWGCWPLLHGRSVCLYYCGVDQMSANAERHSLAIIVCVFFSEVGHGPP